MGANQPLCPLILSRSRLNFNIDFYCLKSTSISTLFSTLFTGNFLALTIVLKHIHKHLSTKHRTNFINFFFFFFFILQEVLVNRNFAKV